MCIRDQYCEMGILPGLGNWGRALMLTAVLNDRRSRRAQVCGSPVGPQLLGCDGLAIVHHDLSSRDILEQEVQGSSSRTGPLVQLPARIGPADRHNCERQPAA